MYKYEQLQHNNYFLAATQSPIIKKRNLYVLRMQLAQVQSVKKCIKIGNMCIKMRALNFCLRTKSKSAHFNTHGANFNTLFYTF